jgi:hypothetical protein
VSIKPFYLVASSRWVGCASGLLLSARATVLSDTDQTIDLLNIVLGRRIAVSNRCWISFILGAYILRCKMPRECRCCANPGKRRRVSNHALSYPSAQSPRVQKAEQTEIDEAEARYRLSSQGGLSLLKGVKSLVYSFCIAFLLVSCGNDRVEKTIAKRMATECRDGAPCRIAVRDITGFAWDKMYACKVTAQPAEINRLLGTSLLRYSEMTRKLFFLKDGKIVHSEDELTNIEHPVDGNVLFDMPDEVNCKDYTPETAVFTVKLKRWENGTYFYLEQMKE